jgi:hypothetical protein
VNRRTRTVLLPVAGALLGLAAVGLARVGGGLDLPWPVPVLAGLGAGLLAAVALTLPGGDPAPTLADAPARPGTAAFGDLGALRFSVDQDSRDAERFETRLRPRLTELTVERLWQRRGLDWRTDAGRAAALDVLPPDLVALLTAPPYALALTPRALDRWIRDLEAL